jgi:hypothetical protein
MDLYGNLLESMMAWCGHTWLRRGPVLTVSMLALGLGVCLNVLSVVDLLWSLGLLANPYQTDGQLRPQHYLCALLCAAFMLNTLLARLKLRADGQRGRAPRSAASKIAAPVYVLVSTGLFLITLLSGLP